MRVDFPEPEGAENMISLPLFAIRRYVLHNVEHLLLDLFQLVFHAHYDALHLGMV